MSLVSKIPCTIVTGFLGAGKTTLVRHLVENAGGRRLAIVVNEFGDIGFDGSFLAACGIEGCGDEDIVELANGCICTPSPTISCLPSTSSSTGPSRPSTS